MAIQLKSTDALALRRFIPLASLPEQQFEQICSNVSVEEGKKAAILFKQGDNKKEFVYLVSGMIELRAGDVEMETIEAGSSSGRFALAHQIPRKVSAIAKGKVRFIRVDTALLTIPEKNTALQSSYEVNDIPEEDSEDWMTTLLQSPVFQRLPAANLQKVMMELEEVPLAAGEILFNQGDPGDYYYIIKEGTCELTRQPTKNAKVFKLAELKSCDAFGEDALISDGKRNLTATMSSAGIILRLHKFKFLNLVKGPVIKYINYSAAKENLGNRCALVDVRHPEEFEKVRIKGSTSIPFFSLRMHLNGLSRNEQQIIVCQDGNTSEAAAFLLIRFGFDAVVLRDGLSQVPSADLEGTDDLEHKVSSIPSASKGQKKVALTPLEESQPDLEQEPAQSAPKIAELEDTLGLLIAEKEQWRAEKKSLIQQKKEMQAALEKQEKLIAQVEKAQQLADAREQEKILQEAGFSQRLHEIQNREKQLQGKVELLLSEKGILDDQLKKKENQTNQQEVELSNLQEQKTTLEQQLKDNIAMLSVVPKDTGQDDALNQEILELRLANDTIKKEQQLAEQQVDELKSVVQAFLDQADSQDYIEETHSLKSELEMVRAQADSDVKTMQTNLDKWRKEANQVGIALEKERQQTAELKVLLQQPTPVNPASTASDGDVFAMPGEASLPSDTEIDDDTMPKKKKRFS